MSHLIARNLEFLEKINNASPEEAKLILQNSTDDNVLALTELALNILQGKLDICLDTYVKLKVHSELIRKLAKRSVSTSNKRKWLVRSLEVLPCLISPLISCLGSCIVKKIIEDGLGNG